MANPFTSPHESVAAQQKFEAIPNEKACLNCGQIKLMDNFYSNRQWMRQFGHDAWCKDCVADCKTKDEIKNYFYNNHRKWDETIWQLACKRAGANLQKQSMGYTRATQGKKAQMRQQAAPRYIPSVMQLRYFYFDPTDKNESFQTTKGLELQKESQKKQAAQKKEQVKGERGRTFSEQFNGFFTQRDLDYLNAKYNQLNQDFAFDDQSTRDYARKVCKASLQLDKAQNDYALGKCSLTDVKDAMFLFDTLSKSANFAACRRKQKESSQVTGWAETTYYLETHGFLKKMEEQWQEDWVDKTVNEYRGSIQNLRLDLL